MTRTIILLSSLLLLLSCTKESKDISNRLRNGLPVAIVDEDQVAIRDLVAVNGDTLIAAISGGGILKTNNGGERWVEIETPLIKHLSVDINLRIWGIDSWVGIHERSYSEILYSDDLGETWQSFTADTKEFFPLKFVGEWNETVQIVTWNGEILEYKAGLPNEPGNWKLVKTLTWDEIEFNPSNPKVDENYRILKTGFLEKRAPDGQWHQLLQIPNISINFDLLNDGNKVYVAAGGFGGYKALFVEVQNDSIQLSREMNSFQSLGVRKDNRGRIWTFGDGGIFRVEGDKLRKML